MGEDAPRRDSRSFSLVPGARSRSTGTRSVRRATTTGEVTGNHPSIHPSIHHRTAARSMFGYAWASRRRPPGKPALYAAIFILAAANIAYATTTKPTKSPARRRRAEDGPLTHSGDSRDTADDDDVVALRKEARRRRSLALFKRQNPGVGDDERR